MSGARRREPALALIDAHGAALRRTARRHSACPDDAEDAFQRALVILLHKAPDCDTAALGRWMHAVVRNEARAVRRSRERLLGPGSSGAGDPAGGAAATVEGMATDCPGPAERAERRERVALAARALATLKPQERRAVALKAAGLSYAEIAELCGWTYTKVNRCLAEGRAALRERLGTIEAT